MLLTKCGSCGRLHRQGTKCPCQKGRHKDYDKARRDKDRAAFYHSGAWLKMQKFIMARAGGCDEYIRHLTGRLVPASIVHHIVPIADRPDMGLSESNLIAVSPATHRMIHDHYAMGANERRAMQGRLLAATGRDEG